MDGSKYTDREHITTPIALPALMAANLEDTLQDDAQS